MERPMCRKGRRWHFHDIQSIDPCYTEMTGLKRMKRIIFGHPDSLQTPLWSHGSRRVLEGLLWLGGILPCSCEGPLWKSKKIASEMMHEFPKDSRKWLYEKCIKLYHIRIFYIWRRFSFDLSCISLGSSTWILLLEFHPSTPTYPTQGTLSSYAMLDAFLLRVVVTSQSVRAHVSICPLEDMMQKLLGKKPWQMAPKAENKTKRSSLWQPKSGGILQKRWNLKRVRRLVGRWPVKVKRPFNLDLLKAWSCEWTS